MNTSKNTTSSLCLLISTALFSYGSQANATESGSIKRCQSIKDKVTLYTDKRRNGGNSRQMNRWQKKRNFYNSLFSSNDCKRYRQSFK